MKRTFTLLFALMSVVVANSQVYYVVPGGAGAKDGTSWANAVESIAEAYNKADATEVRIKVGTYAFETVELKSGVALKGGYTGTDDELSATDATVWTGNDTDTLRFITTPEAGLAAETVISGITFLNNQDTVNRKSDNSIGGAALLRGNVTVKDCIFKGNVANSGGALWIMNDVAGDVNIEYCTFEENVSYYGGAAVSIGDEAGSNAETNIILLSCKFKGNSIVNDGTWVTNGGHTAGAIFFGKGGSGTAKTQLLNCLFDGNYAESEQSSYSAILTSWNNGTTTGFIIDIINCTFVNNEVYANTKATSTTLNDGVICFRYHTSNLYNSIFAGNTVDKPRTIYEGSSGKMVAKNNIYDKTNLSSTVTSTNDDNTAYKLTDLFVAADNYQLKENSPAIDAGDQTLFPDAANAKDITGVVSRVVGSQIDKGAYEYSGGAGIKGAIVAKLISTTVDGNLRLKGFAPNTQVDIYTAAGVKVYSATASGSELNVSLPAHGVYIVSAGNQKAKVLF